MENQTYSSLDLAKPRSHNFQTAQDGTRAKFETQETQAYAHGLNKSPRETGYFQRLNGRTRIYLVPNASHVI